MAYSDHRIIYTGTQKEIANKKLTVIGKIPEWLKGHFVMNGPGFSNFDNVEMKSFFEGFALLRKFTIEQGAVEFATKFVKSDFYKESMQLKLLSHDSPYTNRDLSWLGRLLKPMRIADNTNVTTLKCDDHFIALGGVPIQYEFDINTLETIGEYLYDDRIKIATTSPHSHFDTLTQQYIFAGQQIGLKNYYEILGIKKNTRTRKVLAKIPVKYTSYFHGFGMTEKYFIINHSPIRFDAFKHLFKYLFNNASITESFAWDDRLPSLFIIVDKETGKVVKQIEADPIFINHFANCFEQNDELIFDAPVMKGDFFCHGLNSVILNPDSKSPKINLKRVVINLKSGTCRSEYLTDDYYFELPRINYENFNTKPYQFIYGTIGPDDEKYYFSGIKKVDVISGKSLIYRSGNSILSEAIFVPNPAAKNEDDGVVLVGETDIPSQSLSLVILDAKNMTEIARADTHELLPYNFHSQFLFNLK